MEIKDIPLRAKKMGKKNHADNKQVGVTNPRK
jgi:hypothetical protein